MKKLISIALICLSTSAAAQPVNSCDLISGSAPTSQASDAYVALLRQESFDVLEGELNRRLKAYEAGKDSDAMLYWDLHRALDGGAALKAKIQKWTATRPKSFFANLSGAIYQKNIGFMRRGNNWSNNTSEGQFKAMEQEFAQAVPYANAAMALNPRSALPHTVLQVIASAQFDYKSVQAILAEALRADPKTMAARAIAITRLAPKWGGNFETIQDVVQGAAKANLPDDQINYLVYSAFSERGGQFWMDKDYEKAAFSYGRAVKLCANSSHAVNGYVASAALAKDWDAIIAEVTRLEKAGLVYAQAFRRRGQAYEARKEMDLAVKDFERAVALGEPWSASKLGYMYATGTHVPKNMEKARSLFAMAASQGDFYSQQYLERLNRQDSKSLPPVSGAEAMQPKLTQ